MNDATLQAWVRLALVPGLGPVLIRRLVTLFESPERACAAKVTDLRHVEGIGPKRAQSICKGLDEADPDTEIQKARDAGVDLIVFSDDRYPPALRHIHDPPTLLYVRGRIDPEDVLALAVVGSRRCTHYGREQADRLAGLCAQAGLCIVSGGALGVDAAAHRVACRVGGRTLVVLGCGLNTVYPAEHRQLFDQIADEHGAILSEFPMDTPPLAEHFPRRNRIISGMSLGVLVVEADQRSGAMITARLAAEEHHREVLAIPGRVDSPRSAGCHQMIREGWATLVTGPGDILDALGPAGHTLKQNLSRVARENQAKDLDPSAATMPEQRQRILSKITNEPISLDDLRHLCGLDAAGLQSELTHLQITGMIERLGANQIRRKIRSTPKHSPASISKVDPLPKK